MVLHVARKTHVAFVWLWLPRTYPCLTTCWSRSPLRYLRYSENDVKSLHMLSRCCVSSCPCTIIRLQFNNSRNLHVYSAIFPVSFAEVFGCILTPRVCQFVKLHLFRPTSLHALLYRSRDCAHHPAGFAIFAPLGQLCIFIILICLILLLIGTYKIAQTVSEGNQNLLKHFLSSLLVNPTFSACLISSCSWVVVVAAFSTRVLATVVPLST